MVRLDHLPFASVRSPDQQKRFVFARPITSSPRPFMIFLLGCLLPRFHELTHQRSNLICCGIERVMTAIDNANRTRGTSGRIPTPRKHRR